MSDNLGIFIGNVGRDAELKEVGKDNTLVLNFSIAVATGYGKKKTTHVPSGEIVLRNLSSISPKANVSWSKVKSHLMLMRIKTTRS